MAKHGTGSGRFQTNSNFPDNFCLVKNVEDKETNRNMFRFFHYSNIHDGARFIVRIAFPIVLARSHTRSAPHDITDETKKNI